MGELDPSEIFRQEATELMEQLEVSLLDLDVSPHDQTLVDSAFRALHTIKGSGAMFGFDRVAGFIHDFETAFDHIRKGRSRATPELIKVALDAKDYIRLLIETPDEADPADGVRILDRLARATSVDENPIQIVAAEPAPAQKPELKVPTTWHLDVAFDADILINGSNPLLMFDEIRALGPCKLVADWVNVPPLREFNPQILYLNWTVDVTTDAPITAFDEVFMFVRDDMRLDIARADAPNASRDKAKAAPARAAKAAPEAKVVADTSALPADLKAAATGTVPARASAKDAATIRVPAERLDEMMDRVGELVIVQARLSQIANGDSNNDEVIKSVAEDIARLTTALREAMMGIRMVPIGSLVRPLPSAAP